MMQIIADLHLHSKYSRATSPQMDIQNLGSFAAIKGLNLLGTGDFTHPLHLKDLKNDLIEKDGSGFFVTKNSQDVLFALSAEIALIYSQGEKVRKVHNVILAPSFEIVDQINDELGKRGNLSADGRPIFGKITCAAFVEMMMKISKDILVVPAHAWTPWFSVFGSKSGFDSLQECFEDQTKNIFAIETGLSSDPAMNWRLSQLDNVALISNSDAHSPWSCRLGREANVFDLEKISYA
ncbi:MAG: endonuclease Q family protein, partial [Candidatus Aenigmatarchaeota archaeon]